MGMVRAGVWGASQSNLATGGVGPLDPGVQRTLDFSESPPPALPHKSPPSKGTLSEYLPSSACGLVLLRRGSLAASQGVTLPLSSVCPVLCEGHFSSTHSPATPASTGSLYVPGPNPQAFAHSSLCLGHQLPGSSHYPPKPPPFRGPPHLPACLREPPPPQLLPFSGISSVMYLLTTSCLPTLWMVSSARAGSCLSYQDTQQAHAC